MTQIDRSPAVETSPGPEISTGHEDRSYVRRIVVGAVLGFLVVDLLTMLMCWMVGITVVAAAAVGAFVALFGGVGFGAMMGGSIEQHHG